MRSMENLTLPLSTFQMMDEQRVEIESRMSRCSGCRKWKSNEHLDGSKCGKCGGEVDLSKKPKARCNETAITERIRIGVLETTKLNMLIDKQV